MLIHFFNQSQNFCIEYSRSVLIFLLVSMNIKYLYLCVPMFPAHQYFSVGTQHYQFVALPFVLSATPWVYTKVLALGQALLLGYALYGHFLLREQSAKSLTIWCSDLKKVWFDPEPSEICSRHITYLGLSLDLAEARVFYPIKNLWPSTPRVRLCSPGVIQLYNSAWAFCAWW